MNLELINYKEYKEQIPQKGAHILAQQTEDKILVYQAFNHYIADFAVHNQFFGGANYSYTRMSWIKPNFLWMMYRCGWAEKPNQERVLAMWIKKTDFDKVMEQAAYSSYQENIYQSHENWKKALSEKPVRLQWDPDHDIYGDKQERRAVQLGLKGEILQDFGKNMVTEIIDVTDFVKEQKAFIDNKELSKLLVPQESIYIPQSQELVKKMGITIG